MDGHLQRRNTCLILCPELADHYIKSLKPKQKSGLQDWIKNVKGVGFILVSLIFFS